MFKVCCGLTRQFSTTISRFTLYPQICIVGSGPAGFYTAQQILKGSPDAQVDIYEKLPVPFGLVRYGVAPDHPEVKNCINTFTDAAKNERVSFFGNVAIGQDVSLSDLKQSYHAIVLAYGAAQDKTLNIPGEVSTNVLSARRFVGWYNGLPEDADLKMNLNMEEVAIIGQGNVAIDVARILLTPIDNLKKTDIPEAVLSKLSQSRVRRVTMVGRRRAQDVAFTIKEFREMVNLKGCRTVLRKEDIATLPAIIASAQRPRKRLMELLYKTGMETTLAEGREATESREWGLKFLRSPLEIVPSQDGRSLKGVRLSVNIMEGESAVPSGDTDFLECGLLLRSIGYSSLKIDSSIPFDERTGTILNEGGRVTGQEGLYVSGWVGTGPVGVILATMQSGFTTGKAVLTDLKSQPLHKKAGKKDIIRILASKRILPVSFTDWSSLDRFEVETGKKLGKPREKVVDIAEMVQIAYKDHLV